MIPNTRDELLQRIKEDLGEPVIKVNIARSQLDNAVDDALDFWNQYHNEAQDRTFLKVKVTQDMLNTNTIPMPESVFAVEQIISPNSNGGDLGWMSFEYEMTRDAVFGASSGALGQASGGLSTLVMTKQFLADMKKLLVAPIPFDFRFYKGYITVFDSLEKYVSVGNYLLVEVYGFLYKNGFNIWGDESLRRLATAYAKKYWGQNLKKFSGVALPGGTILNGDSIYNDAMEDIQEQKQWIRSLGEPLGIVLL